MAEYHIITVNDTMIKCFRDGRIFSLFKKTNKYGKKGEWIERTNKPNNQGYISIVISKKRYQAHRLIMMAFVGDSDKDVDHINRIRNDNRFENLRYCTRCENQWNTDKVDKAKGYAWHKNKWQSQIMIDGKVKYLGCFEKEEDAHQSFLDAKLKYSNEL